jgi:hypothetical protein
VSVLRPCPACRRHCRDDAACPFCGAALPTVTSRPAPASTGRLSRAAIFAGAALVAPACGPSTHPASTTSNSAPDTRAGTGRLTGTLTNARTRLPAPDEGIGIRRGSFERTTTTAADGTYSFDDLPVGEYEIVFPGLHRRDDDDDRRTQVTIKRGEVTVVDRAIVPYDPNAAKMPYGAPPVRRRIV